MMMRPHHPTVVHHVVTKLIFKYCYQTLCVPFYTHAYICTGVEQVINSEKKEKCIPQKHICSLAHSSTERASLQMHICCPQYIFSLLNPVLFTYNLFAVPYMMNTWCILTYAYQLSLDRFVICNTSIDIYNQVHKYLYIDKVTGILAVYHSILEFKSNNEYQSNGRLSALIWCIYIQIE